MVVPDFNPDVFASVLANPRQGLYDVSDILAPFKPSQDCAIFSVLRGFGESALANVQSTAEHVTSAFSQNRRLLAGEFDCESVTEKSLSLGQSITYTVSAETPDDPAIVDGDGDMFLFSIHDVLISITNVLVASAPRGASNAETTYENFNQSQSANIDATANSNGNCIVMFPAQVPTASSSGDSQLLWVSQWTINHQIIPLRISTCIIVCSR